MLLWLTILFFMFVSMLPFSTNVLNAFRQTQVAPLFFGANLTAVGWLLCLQWAYAGSQPDMLATFVTRDDRHTVNTRFILIPVTATVGMLVCYWSAQVLLIMYAVLLPWYMIPNRGERRAAQRATSAAQPSEA